MEEIRCESLNAQGSPAAASTRIDIITQSRLEVEISRDRAVIENFVLTALKLSALDFTFAFSPEAVSIRSCPNLTIPTESVLAPEAAFELIQDGVEPDVLIFDRRAKGCCFTGCASVSLRYSSVGANGRGNKGQKSYQDISASHATSTVRNIPISM